MDVQPGNEPQRFADVAQQFCASIDSAHELDRDEFLRRVYSALCALISEGLRLTLVEPATQELSGESRTSEEHWAKVKVLEEKLGAGATYNTYYDPYEAKEHGQASLANDLGEIYFDMKKGLDALDRGKPTADVVFDWRLGFETHWGSHVVDALRALHYLLYL